MPKAAGYLLIWQAERRSYELREHPSQQLLTVTPGEQAWLAWLDTVPSFTFQGQQGQLTARKESRQRGDQYWYAYAGLADGSQRSIWGGPQTSP